jgi:hypothetical protein
VDELCFGTKGVEMTLSHLRLDYPEPEVLAKMPLKKELVSFSAKGIRGRCPEGHPPTQFAKSLHIESLHLNS